MRRTLLTIAVAALAGSAVIVPATTASASAGTYYCLNGWVWRQARPSDHVCVRDTVRTQARADNAAAPTRWTSGASGNHTCVPGYVWRGAFTGDEVCVTPAVRAQTLADNAAAPGLWVTTRLSIRSYTEKPQPGTPVLSDHDIPKILIRGDHFNFGRTMLYIRKTSGEQVWSGAVEATYTKGYAGGSFTVKTPQVRCPRPSDGTAFNGYVQAQDGLSGRWSAKYPVQLGCTVF